MADEDDEFDVGSEDEFFIESSSDDDLGSCLSSVSESSGEIDELLLLAEKEELAAAAAKIQSLWRGFVTRQVVAKIKDMKDEGCEEIKEKLSSGSFVEALELCRNNDNEIGI
jgi:hypothetical protein